jgi:hypothetical protein
MQRWGAALPLALISMSFLIATSRQQLTAQSVNVRNQFELRNQLVRQRGNVGAPPVFSPLRKARGDGAAICGDPTLSGGEV